MKDQETVQEFIELRFKGISFVRIAGQLNVAKRHPRTETDPPNTQNHTDFGQFWTDSAP